MTAISVVYHSGTGHTTKMAEAVAKGATSVDGVEATLISIEGKDIVNGRWWNDEVMKQLDASDGIIFGSPTYMGGVSGQMECFLDATDKRWLEQGWRDKVAGGFSVSGGLCGSKFNVLLRFITLAMHQGMVWVGLGAIPSEDGLNRLCFFLGAAGEADQESPDQAPNEADKMTAEHLGRRVAETTRRLHK